MKARAKLDLDIAAEMRPRFAVAADAARKAVLAGLDGRWDVAPETYVEPTLKPGAVLLEAVVGNFLLCKVRRGYRARGLRDLDLVLRRWVKEGPGMLVAEARTAISVLLTSGTRDASMARLAASCVRIRP